MRTDSASQPAKAPPADFANNGKVRWSLAYWIALICVLLLSLSCQIRRWGADEAASQPDWWAGRSPDWLPFIPVLVLAPLCWFVRRPLVPRVPQWWSRVGVWGAESCPTASKPVSSWEGLRAVICSLIVAALALGMSWHVGGQFGDLPPAYHDEFSYLFQAETFLHGRLAFPSHREMPELFDQMHVLNEGRFASRYFPGVGLWMAPFVALGHPWWGHWIAHSIASFLLFWIGRHLGNNAVGLLAGLLLAVSPGVALFSNLLLAHHPTLVGLLVFVITFLKLQRAVDEGGRVWLWALLSGYGLTFAMLCRPMTAAGVGLPFGLWFGWWILTGRPTVLASHDEPATTWSTLRRWGAGASMALPIAAGLCGLYYYNLAITGDGLVTPYQQYTRVYTPRHVYGFNNVVRGEQHLGPKVIENYDVWAANLTPALAAKNVWQRLSASLRWTLGIVPLIWAALLFLATFRNWSTGWWLTAAAIVSLHVVHIPYWFEGIMGWHYVFETAPFWLLIFSGVSQQLWQQWSLTSRSGMQLWWWCFLGVALVVNLVTIPPLWPARLDVGMVEVLFARERYADFYSRVEETVAGRRALVLVIPDAADRHMDYLVNSPALDAQILYGRFREGQTDLEQVVATFANRDIWLVDVAAGTIQKIADASG